MASHQLAISMYFDTCYQIRCIPEQTAALYMTAICRRIHCNTVRLIKILHTCHLGRRRPVRIAEGNAVAAEIIIRRTLTAVSAISGIRLPIPVFQRDTLINIIPDETSLVQRIFLCQIRVLKHTPVGVAHRMRVLTANVRFVAVFLQVIPNLFHRRIHM